MWVEFVVSVMFLVFTFKSMVYVQVCSLRYFSAILFSMISAFCCFCAYFSKCIFSYPWCKETCTSFQYTLLKVFLQQFLWLTVWWRIVLCIQGGIYTKEGVTRHLVVKHFIPALSHLMPLGRFAIQSTECSCCITLSHCPKDTGSFNFFTWFLGWNTIAQISYW